MINQKELKTMKDILDKLFKEYKGYVNPITEKEIRAERDRLLSACDYVLASDSQASEDCKAAYVVYRQALRDITEQESYPAAVEWPEEPAYEKAEEVE